MIGVDWGTTGLRAYRFGRDGAVIARREATLGVMQVGAQGFPVVLREQIGEWLEDGEHRVLLAGMIGSRQGWVEAPYLPCPAGPAEIASALIDVPFEGASVKLAPGVSGQDQGGVPEVMRGEETQLVGVMETLGGNGVACLPGTHSKWARVQGGRIAGFTTHMTGEVFAALRGHTILGRMMQDGPTHEAAFDRGVARAGEAGGLLHHLFGVRALGLSGELAQPDAASYLSGLLIGHEIRAALPGREPVYLLGAPALCALYARAIAACGATAVIGREDAAAHGLHRVAELTAWS